jgi:mannose-6-phosphate isomerase-like protein (cupin superfamily)|tara:strand:+ start:3524 stop:3889 length:366 start_codon:yes stop_codon:yes gene_type:complete
MTSSQNDPIKFVPKGWGYEKWITNGPLYCGKILWFCKGKKCSWHYHNQKDEVFYVQSGKLMVYWSNFDDFEMAYVKELNPGEKFHVPSGMRHRMRALEDTVMYEFSTEHFDEDSIRIERGD